MGDDFDTRLRDGEPHKFGPLCLTHTGLGERGSEGTVTIETPDRGPISVAVNWMDAEAIAFCIEPCASAWGASESDINPKGTGELGLLRLTFSSEQAKLPRSLWRMASRRFQLAALVMNCGHRQGAFQRAQPEDEPGRLHSIEAMVRLVLWEGGDPAVDWRRHAAELYDSGYPMPMALFDGLGRRGKRTYDYRRSMLFKGGGPRKGPIRPAFIETCEQMGRHLDGDLPIDWRYQAQARWDAADDIARWPLVELLDSLRALAAKG